MTPLSCAGVFRKTLSYERSRSKVCKPLISLLLSSTAKETPNKVTVTFTMALNALLKGHTATIILMVEAVELGKPGAATGMDTGKPFEPVASLPGQVPGKGRADRNCGACMIHNGMTAEQMDPRFSVITAPDVIELLMGAKGSLQVT